MSRRQQRSILIASLVLATVWVLALSGYSFFKSRQVTAEKVAAYLGAVDLNRLSGGARQRALRELEDKMNALSFEERRKARMDERWRDWFRAMTEEEKSQFIEATMPSGFKAMLSSFEKLPEDKRRKAIDNSIRDLRRARDEVAAEEGHSPFRLGTNRPPALSDDLRQKIITLGLKSFYSEASAQTKAEAAPLLEEMQRAMESGRLFRIHH